MIDARKHRIFVVIWAVVETSLYGGVMHGWSSLVYVAKEEGIYSFLCTQNISYNQYTSNTTFESFDLTTLAGSINVTMTGHDTADEYNISQGSHLGQGNGKLDLPIRFHLKGYNISTRITKFPQCKEQDSVIAFRQTVIGSTTFIGMLSLGQIHRRFGTKKLRILHWFLLVFGCLCTAFVSNDAPWLIFVTYWTVGVAGIALLTTNIQVSNLFTSSSGIVISLICGGYDFAGSVLLFIKLSYEAGLSLMTCFLVLAGVSVITLISTICWLPWKIFKKIDDEVPNTQYRETEVCLSQEDVQLESISPEEHTETFLPPTQLVESRKHIMPLREHIMPLREQIVQLREQGVPLRTSLASPIFLLHVVWYIILQIRFSYFVSLLNPYLVQVTNSDTEQVSHFTNVFLYVSMFGYVTSFMAGGIYDWQKAKYKYASPLKKSLMPAVLPLSLGSLISVLVSVLMLLPDLNVLYAIFVLQTAYRSFLYSIAATFISQVFPADHFSGLYTLMVICGGLVNFSLYGLYSWSHAYDGAPYHVYGMLLCLALGSFLHPVHIVLRCRRDTPACNDKEEMTPEQNMLEDARKCSDPI